MSMPFPTGMELSAVAAVAVVLTLAGMGLTRLAAQIIGFDTRPAKHLSPMPAARLDSRRIANPIAITKPVGLSADSWTTKSQALLSALNAILNWIQSRTLAPRSSAQPSVKSRAAVSPLPQRLTIDDQWERSTSIVNRAVNASQTMRTAHVAAGEKLDAAHYALEKLMRELEGLISLNAAPAEIAVFKRASNVVNLLKTPTIAARAAA